MVEPQRLSIDLSQRWMRGSAPLAPELALPAHESSAAAQPEAPLQSPASAAVNASEVCQGLRALWPFGRKSSGPASTAGMASLAVNVSASASTGSIAVAKASTVGHLPDNPKVHVAAFAVTVQAATEQLQPVRESEEAEQCLSAGAALSTDASTHEMYINSSLVHTRARYHISPRTIFKVLHCMGEKSCAYSGAGECWVPCI